MNAQQRRRLKRIRQRQRESAERKLNQGDRQFVIAHTPPPTRICVMSDAESQRFHAVAIGHRCTSTEHRHYTRKHVEELVGRAALRWVGKHFRIAAWVEDKNWAKVYNRAGEIGEVISCGMQLVRGSR